MLNLEWSVAAGQNCLTPEALGVLWPALAAGNYPFAMVLRDALTSSGMKLRPPPLSLKVRSTRRG